MADDQGLESKRDYAAESLYYNYESLIVNKKILYTTIVINMFLAFSTLFIHIETLKLISSASQQASAANDANKIAADNGKKQIRAYLTVDDIETNFINSPKMESILTVKNAGQTPAYEASFFGQGIIMPLINGKVIPKGYHLTVCPRYIDEQGVFTLGSGRSIPSHLIRNNQENFYIDSYSQNDIDNLKSGKSGYLIRGVLCYKDVFFSDIRSTYYCMYYKNYDSLIANTWTACDKENEVN